MVIGGGSWNGQHLYQFQYQLVRIWKINQHLTIMVEGTDKPS